MIDEISQNLVFNNLVKNIIYELNMRRLKAVIIAWGGSYSMGLQNRASDIDFYAIIQNDRMMEIPECCSFYDCNIQQQIDVMCVSIDAIIQDIVEYNEISHCYPTYVFREKNLDMGQVKDMQRDDFKRGMVFRTILSDFVWIKDGIEKCFSLFRDILQRKYVLDFYFTRAIGNYDNFIVGKERVAVRKYLYTLHEIWYCQWIMTKDTIPPMNFMKLESEMSDDIGNLKKKVQGLLSKNYDACLAKEILVVNSDEEINQYIKEKLIWIGKELPSIVGAYQCKNIL